MRTVAVIPARYGSTRLPGKPLANLLGKPMVQHVYERVAQVAVLDEVIVATDDQRIFDVVHGFGGRAVLTSSKHPSGTDRLVEVQQTVKADLYLNVQGDEPLVEPGHLTMLLDAMTNDRDCEVGTLCHPISSSEADNPNSVKVVLSHQCQALYFSRAKIPYPRAGEFEPVFNKHVGVYAYRASVLERFSELPCSSLENAEQLEQLRLLQAGLRIKVVKVPYAAPGVDSPECLERVRRLMSGLPAELPSGMSDIKLVITDIDGVLTDGSIWYDENGECLKRFHVRDGMGIKMLQEVGVVVAVISGRDSAALRRRLQDLGISVFRLGVKDKARACSDLQREIGATKQETAILGDDSIDLPAFRCCEWSIAVADAPVYVRSAAKVTLQKRGGEGAFREFSDSVLSAKGRMNIFDSADGYRAVMQHMAQ